MHTIARRDQKDFTLGHINKKGSCTTIKLRNFPISSMKIQHEYSHDSKDTKKSVDSMDFNETSLPRRPNQIGIKLQLIIRYLSIGLKDAVNLMDIKYSTQFYMF